PPSRWSLHARSSPELLSAESPAPEQVLAEVAALDPTAPLWRQGRSVLAPHLCSAPQAWRQTAERWSACRPLQMSIRRAANSLPVKSPFLQTVAWSPLPLAWGAAGGSPGGRA